MRATMNAEQQSGRLAPYALVCFLTLIIGFFTAVNGQMQGPLKESILGDVSGFKNALSNLITFCFFLAFLLHGKMGGNWVNRLGYKGTLLRSMGFLIAGLLCFALTAQLVTSIPHLHVCIAGIHLPLTYFVFLLGSYLLGTSSAVGLAAINPYVTAYPLAGTQAVQRLNIACAFNSVGTTMAPYFVTGILFAGVALSDVKAEQMLMPSLLLALGILLTLLFTARCNVPDIEGTRNESEEKLERSVWSFRHLRLGVVTAFCYLGCEVAVGANITMHSAALFAQNPDALFFGVQLNIPTLMATCYWGGMLIGRLASGLLAHVSPRTLLTFGSLGSACLVLMGMLTQDLWFIVAVGLCHSVMWGGVFTLAVDGLGKYTSLASGALVMGVFGAGVLPLAQGLIADAVCWQWSWGLILLAELWVFYYARWGSRNKE